MRMEGGGSYNVAPGQITDDSELAMCLMRGIIDGKGKFNTAHIVKYYDQWLSDGPFDICPTIKNSFSAIDSKNPSPIAPRSVAYSQNKQDLSNVSLMKIMPLAVWTQNLTENEVSDAVKRDVEIIHPGVVMPNLVTSYCLAIRFLIKNHSEEDRAQRAFDIAKEHAK